MLNRQQHKKENDNKKTVKHPALSNPHVIWLWNDLGMTGASFESETARVSVLAGCGGSTAGA